jgi:F-type H+-transporting ATPase subunit b
MLIDWFTVGAQALNFLILVWLLKRFLYKPILDAIDARERRVAAELATADAKKAEAQRERDEFQKKNEEFDRQRAALLAKVADEAKAERQRLFDEVRTAADSLSAKRREALRSEARNLDHDLRRLTQQEVFAIARKALADLATASLEERMCDVFKRRLSTMAAEAKEELAQALKAAPQSALVRSAFELPPDQRAGIQKALNETFQTDARVRFETAPDLVSGIELAAQGRKMSWSIGEYLSSLEKSVSKLLEESEKSEPEATPGAKGKVQPKVDAAAASTRAPRRESEGSA